MVCLGNICRSPLAEGIMLREIEAHDLDWSVDSAGTGSWHVGEAPDKRSIAVAKANKIDISKQRARKFTAADLDAFDLILAMDSSNFNNILSKASSESQKEKVKIILNFVYPGQNRSVPDPYYNGSFEEVFNLLDKACKEIITQYAIQ